RPVLWRRRTISRAAHRSGHAGRLRLYVQLRSQPSHRGRVGSPGRAESRARGSRHSRNGCPWLSRVRAEAGNRHRSVGINGSAYGILVERAGDDDGCGGATAAAVTLASGSVAGPSQRSTERIVGAHSATGTGLSGTSRVGRPAYVLGHGVRHELRRVQVDGCARSGDDDRSVAFLGATQVRRAALSASGIETSRGPDAQGPGAGRNPLATVAGAKEASGNPTGGS